MNKIVVAIDSVKGSLSTFESGRAVEGAMNVNNAFNNLKETARQGFRLLK